MVVLFLARLGSLNALEQTHASRSWPRWLLGALPSADTVGRVCAQVEPSDVRALHHSIYTTNVQSLVASTRFCSLFLVLYGLTRLQLVLRNGGQPLAPGGAVSCSLGREPQDLGDSPRKAPQRGDVGIRGTFAGGPRREHDIAPPGLERLRASDPWGWRNAVDLSNIHSIRPSLNPLVYFPLGDPRLWRSWFLGAVVLDLSDLFQQLGKLFQGPQRIISHQHGNILA